MNRRLGEQWKSLVLSLAYSTLSAGCYIGGGGAEHNAEEAGGGVSSSLGDEADGVSSTGSRATGDDDGDPRSGSDSTGADTDPEVGSDTSSSTGPGEEGPVEIYLSDRFDSHDDWVGNVDGEAIDPPPPWWNYGYYNSTDNRIDDVDDAYGRGGKCYAVSWPTGMAERALMTPPETVTGKRDLWIGFHWRHSPDWQWGGDRTHKWFYGPETNDGDRMMINFDKRHRAFWQGKTQLTSNIDFDVDDSSWHEVVIFIRHSSGDERDGAIRMWWDGTEVLWSTDGGDYEDNRSLRFGTGSTWTQWMAFGFQSRPDWGAGNETYFDNIIVANSRSAVVSFLSGLDAE